MKHVGFVHPYFHLVPELRDVNIQVNEKQMVVAFTGAINSGYSIPLKLILQFYKPTSGSVVSRHYVLLRQKEGILSPLAS